ncbi:MAG: GAF domain-containing sensor histidine kinase [Chloroflexota bacterium]|nr:GAF domain-containing sensor histidine kinase [Chloroflexota bacterium]
MANSTTGLGWRDWYIFAARLLAIGGGLFFILYSKGITSLPQESILPLVIAVVANVVFALVILMPWRIADIPTLLITDWIIVGALYYVNQRLLPPTPQVMLPLIVGFMILSFLRPSIIYTALSLAGAVALGLYFRAAPIDSSMTLLLVLTILLGLAAAYALQRQTHSLRTTFAALADQRKAQLEDIHERTRAIYEMLMTFSETQHFERILNAALDAGQLGLRGRMGKNLAAAVMLFQSDEPGLQIIASRKFTPADKTTPAPGRSGIIGQALREAVPVIGKRGKDDPELQYYAGMQGCRSTLCVPMRAGYDNYGVLLYGSESTDAFTEEHTELLTAIGVQATIALQNYVLYQTLLEEKERISRVAEDERKQLARQLHDGPTQKVSALAMMTSIISKMLEKAPEQIPDELRKMEEIARSTTKDMRHMLFTLRPLVLEDQGLSAALQQLAEKMRDTYGQDVQVRVESNIENVLDQSQQAVVFYLVEEAINNARKHAQAKLIGVDVRHKNGDLVIQIADNGVGFDVNKMSANYNSRASSSLGMVNMKERAALLNGNLTIDSTPGKGTRVTVVAPLTFKQTMPIVDDDDTLSGIPLDRSKLAAAKKKPLRQ